MYWQFKQWEKRQVTQRILDRLREEVRVAEGRDPQPSAGIIDSQSVKGADTVGVGSRGYDAGKRINGRKRFIVTDTLGLLVTVWVLAASSQDRDGRRAPWSPRTPRRRSGTCSPIRASPAGWCQHVLHTTLEIVRKPADQEGFVVHPRRWVIERTLAWITSYRRLARDYGCDPAVSEALIRWAAINQMVRRLARSGPARRRQRHTFDQPD